MSDGTREAQRSTFGPASLTLLVVASMVGAGVFTTSGFTLGVVGSPARVMLCWVIGGHIAISGAIAYGRLARIVPESGGEYLYLNRHLHPFAGFLAGWVSLTAGFSGAIATAAVAFEAYAVPEGLRPSWLPPDSIAITVVIVCGLLHGRWQRNGRMIQNAVVCLKIVCLAIFLIYGLSRLPDNAHRLAIPAQEPHGVQLWYAVATSVVWISLSFAGFNAAVYVASESSEARQNVPRALLWGTFAVTLLYLALNLVFVTATEPASLEWQEDVAALAANALGGPAFETLIRIAVALGLLSSVSGMVLSGPRVYSRMADDGVFPAAFRADRDGIPKSVAMQTMIAVVLILVQRGLVSAGVLSSSLLGLLIYLGTTLSISSAFCVATLFLPSVRGKMDRASVGNDLAAGVYVLATLAAVVLLVVSHEVDGQWKGLHHLTGALLTLGSGIVAWFVFRGQNDPATAAGHSKSLSVPPDSESDVGR